MEHGYTCINQISKFQYLSNNIKTTGLDSVKTRIMSDEVLRQDFCGCVTLYKDFVNKSNVESLFLGIVLISLNNASGNKSALFAPEDRYYESSEWYALSKDYEYNFLKMRSGRNEWKKASKLGGYSKSGGVGNSRKWKSKIANL